MLPSSRRQRSRQRKLDYTVFLISLALTAILVIIYITSYHTPDSHQQLKIDTQKSQLKLENQLLIDQIAHYSSLNYIEGWAYARGYTKVKATQFITERDILNVIRTH